MRIPILVVLLTVSLGITSFAAPLHAAPIAQTAPVGPGDVYLALGDSLSVGVESTLNNDNLPGYPDTIYATLKAFSPYRNLSYKNLGVSGETTTTMSNTGQLAAAEAFIASERSAGRRVGLITVSIGGNDLLSVLQGTSTVTTALTAMQTNYGYILDRLVSAVTVEGQRTADILVMTYYNPYPDQVIGPPIINPPFPPVSTNQAVQVFNGIIQVEAAKRNIAVARTDLAFLGNEPAYIFVNLAQCLAFVDVFRNCDYHPREAGHKAIARSFVELSGLVKRTYLPLNITP